MKQKQEPDKGVPFPLFRFREIYTIKEIEKDAQVESSNGLVMFMNMTNVQMVR